MKVLFTKKIDVSKTSQVFEEGIEIRWQEFIKIEYQRVPLIDVFGKVLIFTSVNGVKAFFEGGFSIDGNRIFVVGSKTEKALMERGFCVEKTFDYAFEMEKFINYNAHRECFLHFCGNLSLDILCPSECYQKVVVYQTSLLYPKVEQGYDVLVFFSPSAVRSFAKYNSFDKIQCFAIGKTTEKELKKYTTKEIITSQKANFEGILHEILKFKND